ncbi:MAG: exodeoxyribonuclease VII large subunit [Ignavibacteriales bacterium]|nr:MAG: exodeoxyribonuclease VII large subunit [Ignavibacteriales bacterium]
MISKNNSTLFDNGNEIYSVSELTKLIKIHLEEEFNDITVEGELSNFKAHVSGHWYFNLKDATALISCTMWRGLNSYVFFTPSDGMKVIIKGRITVYPPRGNYQIEVRSMKPAGEGELQAAFEKLKRKLQAEGLFDEEHKKELPEFPDKIGVVTAIDGAAFRDIISVTRRRYPLVEIVIAPAKVQGEGAAQSIVDGIKLLNQKGDINLIVIGRGGGSLEDLWAFNEEIVAREIFKSKIPVISAVGHEIDFTIADFVADVRAATPSAAMEIATPDAEQILSFLKEFPLNSGLNISYILEAKKNKILNVISSYGFRAPQDKLKIKAQQLDTLIYKFRQKIDQKIIRIKNRLALAEVKLEGADVNRILKKGFALILQHNEIIPRAASFTNSETAKIKFYDNEIEVRKT